MRNKRVWIGVAGVAAILWIGVATELSNDSMSDASATQAVPAPPGGAPVGMPTAMPGFMNPMMMGGMAPAGGALAVTADGHVYVLRGDTLFKYSPDLKLLASTDLPAPVAGMPGGRTTPK